MYLLQLPSACLRLGEYWFRISRYVYVRNRPLAPILRQSRCSLGSKLAVAEGEKADVDEDVDG
jgi:hypothetical protein